MRWLIILFVVVSCQYKPEGKYVSPVKPPDQSVPVHISLDGYDNQSTIPLFGPTSNIIFHYSVDVGVLKHEKTKITLDGETRYEGSDQAGTFKLPSYYISTTVKLKIEFLASANTGSLADHLGAEKYETWREWTLVIDADLPATPTFTQSVVDGYSTLQWSTYDKANFVNYHISAQYVGVQKSRIFTNPATNTWTDSLYSGGSNVTYYFYVTNSNGTASKSITYSSPVSYSATYNKADSMVTVVTTPVLFTHAFEKFTIFESNSPLPGSTFRAEIVDPMQTTTTFKVTRVGYNYTTIIEVDYRVKPPSTSRYLGAIQLNTSVTLPRLSRVMSNYHFNATLNQVIGQIGSGASARLVRMDPVTFAPLDSVSIVLTPSYYVPYLGTYAYYSNPKDVVQVNLIDHSTVSYTAIPSGVFGSGPNVITAGGNQVVGFAWFGPRPGGGTNYYERAYDLSNGQTVYTEDLTPVPAHAVSHDGQFMRATNGRIYNLVGGSMQLLGPTAFTGTFLGYRPDRSDEMIVRNGTSDIRIYNSMTGQLKRTILQKGSYLGYDPPTKNLAFYNADQKVYLVDIDTQQTKFYLINAGPRLVNGTLIMPNGDYLKVQ